MATSFNNKTSLELIPILKGREDYLIWAKQMKSHLKALNAWEIITEKWRKLLEPSYFEAPIRPQDLINDQREAHHRRQEADTETTPSSFAPISIKDAEKELGYIKTHIEQWNRYEKTERVAINDIQSRVSETCKRELGNLNNLSEIWEKLRTLYIEVTCGTWVKKLNTLFKLKGARKIRENPDE